MHQSVKPNGTCVPIQSNSTLSVATFLNKIPFTVLGLRFAGDRFLVYTTRQRPDTSRDRVAGSGARHVTGDRDVGDVDVSDVDVRENENGRLSAVHSRDRH